MDIFILAHGESDRWTDTFSTRIARTRRIPQYKQLLEVAGMPLPVATAAMVSYLFEQNVGLTVEPKLIARWELRNRISFEPAATYVYVPTILHTINHCFKGTAGDGTLFLLGDVVYAPSDLTSLIDSTEDFKFLGRRSTNPFTLKHTPELYGLMVREAGYERLFTSLEFLLDQHERSLKLVKLWDLLALMSGKRSEADCIIEAQSYTDDVDSIEEYERYWPKLSRLARDDY